MYLGVGVAVYTRVGGEGELQLRDAPFTEDLHDNRLINTASRLPLPCLVKPFGVALGNVLAGIRIVRLVRCRQR